MVAVLTYLLGSSTVSSLESFFNHIPIARSPLPDVEHGPSTSESKATDAFDSVRGPLIESNFADPAIIHVDGVSYAFATNNRKVGPKLIHVQVATSTDNTTWKLSKTDALPQVAAWQTGARVWAPDVVQIENGSFVMYYTDELKAAPAHHCVGVATSKNVTGPFIPASTPFACPDVYTLGGAIDPDGFLDPLTHKRYVTYKVDGNSLGRGGACMNMVAPIKSTPIMLQEVAADGVTRVGNAIQILDRDDRDGPLIEAPSLHRSDDGVYFLFYSSNCFTTPLYDVSYATATNITGPYIRANRPLIATNDVPGLLGPGGIDIIQGGNMVVFHGHLPVNKNRLLENQVETQSQAIGKPNRDVNVPLVRGMYSGTVTFRWRTASLAEK